jgi:EmrB/QacA subfamily drug resistance transporter
MLHPTAVIGRTTHRKVRCRRTAEEVSTSPIRWWVLGALAAAASLGYLDLFSVNVALPSMAEDLGHASLSSISWVLNAYAITFAVLLVPMGRLADHYGRRKFLLSGVSLFVAGSIVSGVAPDLGVMLVGRVIQAVGAAMFLPASLGLLFPSFVPSEQAKVLGVWAGVGAVAAGSGPSIGGVLTAVDWRLIFAVNVLIGLGSLVVGFRVLPEVKETVASKLPDSLSIVALVATLGLVTFGTVQSGTWGWGDTKTIIILAVAGVALLVTIWRSLTSPRALIEADLFRNAEFSTAALALFMFSLGLAIYLLSSVLYFQDVWHWNAIQTGLGVAPGPLGAAIVALNAGKVIEKYGKSLPAIIGPAMFAIGAASWIVTVKVSPHNYWWGYAPACFLEGCGAGLLQPPLYAAASSLNADRQTTGSGVLNMANSVGSAIGVAILVTILASDSSLSGFRQGWLVIVISMGIASLASLLFWAVKVRGANSPVTETHSIDGGTGPEDLPPVAAAAIE